MLWHSNFCSVFNSGGEDEPETGAWNLAVGPVFISLFGGVDILLTDFVGIAFSGGAVLFGCSIFFAKIFGGPSLAGEPSLLAKPILGASMPTFFTASGFMLVSFVETCDFDSTPPVFATWTFNPGGGFNCVGSPGFELIFTKFVPGNFLSPGKSFGDFPIIAFFVIKGAGFSPALIPSDIF